jgi:hypothetical protein
MEHISPWISTDADLRRMREFVRQLVGRILVSVSYTAPIGMSGWGRELGAADEIHAGVALMLSTGGATETLYIAWLNQGLCEGLKFQAYYSGDGHVGVEAFEVSESSHWLGLIGDRISSVGVSFHDPHDHAPRAVWSIRLSFASGRAVSIALGQLGTEGAFEYSPDTILAIFDAEVGSGYSIPASIFSAWGQEA